MQGSARIGCKGNGTAQIIGKSIEGDGGGSVLHRKFACAQNNQGLACLGKVAKRTDAEISVHRGETVAIQLHCGGGEVEGQIPEAGGSTKIAEKIVRPARIFIHGILQTEITKIG